jgi:hypothetical protein
MTHKIVGQSCSGPGCAVPRKAGIDADLLREAEQHVVEITARHGRHSVTSCPPGTRAMCRYADVLRRTNDA